MHGLMQGESKAMFQSATEMTRLNGFLMSRRASVSLWATKMEWHPAGIEPCPSVLPGASY